MFVPPSTMPKTYTYRNIGKVIDKGFELSGDVLLDEGVMLTGTYSYQAEPEVSDNDPVQPLIVNVPPENQFSLYLNTARGRWFGSFGVTYTGEAFWSDVLDSRFWGTTSSYALVNGSAGVKLGGDRYLLSVRATNLGDKKVQQHVFGDIIGRKVTAEFSTNF
jgi:outer membrane receptor for ferric coprogen and ferric-rhodotorulic acid